MKWWENVRTITVVTEPEPEGPIVKLGIGKRDVTNVVRISPREISRIRVDRTEGRFEADFQLTEKIGIHGKFSYIAEKPIICRIENETLHCELAKLEV